MAWDDVRYFLALARLGSVRAAGSTLGVSHSTVLRRVEALEGELSVRLFDRSRDGWTLTAAGEQMLPGAERVEAEMSSLERGLAGRDERLAGEVAITCSDGWVADLLVEGLVPFCEAYPDIELQLGTDSRPYDLTRREADIAVRMIRVGASPPEHLIGRQVARVTLGNYVARAHASRRDPDVEGSEPRWAAFDDRRLMEEMVARSSYPGLPVWGSFASVALMVTAIRRGLGVGMLPTYVGDREPTLRRLASPDLRHVADLWVLSHPDVRANARYRATREHITRLLSDHAPLFGGACPVDAPAGSETARGDDGGAPIG